MAEQPIRHLEPLLDAAVASLRAGLPTAIAAVNAAHSDFQVETVPDDAMFVGGFTTAVYPMIEVASPDWTMQQLSVGQFSSELAWPLVVKVTAMDMTAQLLYRRLLRYVSAILAVLLDPDAIPGCDVDRDRGVRGAYAFNPESGEIQELDGAAIIVLYMGADETRT
jgi:hypothetical protein